MTIYPNPGFSYQAYVFASKQVPSSTPSTGSAGQYFGNASRYADGTVKLEPPNSVAAAGFVFSGQDLQVTNLFGASATLTWSVLVVQIA